MHFRDWSVNGVTPRASVDDVDRGVNTTAQPLQHEPFVTSSKDVLSTSNNLQIRNRSRFLKSPSPSSVWRRGWKVTFGIIGFYVLALLFAVAHHSLFIYLDGRIINLTNEPLPFGSTDIPQSYATTLSLALVTAFRATMVASVGMCYTQCLWKKLRSELLQIGLIEELFQIRSNFLRLFKPAVIWYAPVLLSVAVLSWLLPVAMIYPPGALTVELEYRDVSGQFNASVMPRGSNFDPFVERPDSLIYSNTSTGFGKIRILNEGKITSNLSEKMFYYDEPQPNLKYAAKQVLASSKIMELDRPSALNVSYTLSFPGPILECRGPYERVNITVPQAGELEQVNETRGNHTRYEAWRMNMNLPTYLITHETGTILIEEPATHNASLSVTPCPRTTNESYTVEETGQSSSFARFEFANGTAFFNPVVWRECRAAIVEYNLNISFTNGIQTITHTIGEEKTALPDPMPKVFHAGNGSDFGAMNSVQEYVNLVSIVDSLSNNFDLEGRKIVQITFNMADLENPQWQNITYDSGVEVNHQACNARMTRDSGMQGSSIMAVSVFNSGRLENNDLGTLDPTAFDTSENLLNEALINITISSLSLGVHYEMVNGSSTRVFNVYHFEKRLSFYVPYGLCLLFTIPVLVAGLLALHHNGVTAIDGGFVQLLMTTTGRTELENIAAQGCLGGEENVPKELRKLRVRFGEMITGDVEDSAHLMHPRGVHRGANKSTSNAASWRYNDQEESVERARTPGSAGETPDTEYSDDVERGTVHENDVQRTSGAEAHGPSRVVLRRAGFGLSDEIIPLEKHIQYGQLKTGT